jgi:eight-cysteine-cluster-containing protein
MRTSCLLLLALMAGSCACATAGDAGVETRPSDEASRKGAAAQAVPARLPTVDPKDPLYPRVEGERLDNLCRDDSQCRVGGCSGEVCSAAEGVVTTCEMHRWPQGESKCGCVKGTCVWYRTEEQGNSASLLPGQGEACREGKCPPPLKCVKHSGADASARPEIDSCEIPCAKSGTTCPAGQACADLMEGPVRVCRPGP